jgi:hypothetical protein
MEKKCLSFPLARTAWHSHESSVKNAFRSWKEKVQEEDPSGDRSCSATLAAFCYLSGEKKRRVEFLLSWNASFASKPGSELQFDSCVDSLMFLNLHFSVIKIDVYTEDARFIH